jgi:hypothetical protein
MLSSPRRSMPWIRFSLARPPHDDVLSQETSETSDLGSYKVKTSTGMAIGACLRG